MKNFLLIVSLLVATSVSTNAEELDSSNSVAPKTSRIVGGDKALFGAWPSTVALLDAGKVRNVEQGIEIGSNGFPISFSDANAYAQFCGASLIDSRWVLTAAHCVVDKNTGQKIQSSRITALVGTSDLASGGERMSIRRIIIHPNYNNTTLDSDIALIELNYNVGVVTIPVSKDDIPQGILATVVGWGALREDESLFPYELYEVDVPIVSRASCINLHGSEFTSNMICAGYDAGVKDTCKGDSGGPLMAVQYGELVQAGITSWGVGCGQAGQYGVYTRLSNFKYWIDSTMLNASSGGGSFYFLLFPFLLLSFTRIFLIKGGK
jgi:trypsin